MEVDNGVVRVRRFRVNLDEDPATRWNHVLEPYLNDIKATEQRLERMYLSSTKASVAESLLTSFFSTAVKVDRIYYAKELKGMADFIGIDVGRLVALQLVYEASAACTSVVLDTPDGHPVHVRTMDWDMAFLKPLTIEVDFYQDDALLYRATTWAGYVGILTAMRPKAYSVSVNFRATGDGYWENVKLAMSHRWPIGFLLRENMETRDNFEDAVYCLANSEIIAPVYFTVCGVRPGEGALITRNRMDEERRWTLAADGFIAQTNTDHCGAETGTREDDCSRRRLTCRRVTALIRSGRVTAEKLFGLMSEDPINDGTTIYCTYMCAATSEMETRIPEVSHGFKRAADAEVPIDQAVCDLCESTYTVSLNPKRMCAHPGTWHASYADCSKLKCAWKLKTKIGQQHWSCCYSTDAEPKGPCRKSGKHDDADDTASGSSSEEAEAQSEGEGEGTTEGSTMPSGVSSVSH